MLPPLHSRVVLLFLAANRWGGAAADDDPRVKVVDPEHGNITYVGVFDAFNHSSVVVGQAEAFLGIKYAEAERFEPAELYLVPPENDEFEAVDYGPYCPQTRKREPMTEDCLYLNIWRPSTVVAENDANLVDGDDADGVDGHNPDQVDDGSLGDGDDADLGGGDNADQGDGDDAGLGDAGLGDAGLGDGNNAGQGDGDDAGQGNGAASDQGDDNDSDQGEGDDADQGDGDNTDLGKGDDGRNADQANGDVADQGDSDDADQGDDDDADHGEGDDADHGEGDDADHGEGDDADHGEGDDAEQGVGDDAEQGVGDDAEQGVGDDAEQSEGDDAEQSEGDNVDQGDGDSAGQDDGDNASQADGDIFDQVDGTDQGDDDVVDQGVGDKSDQGSGNNADQVGGDNADQGDVNEADQGDVDNADQADGDNAHQADGDDTDQAEGVVDNADQADVDNDGQGDGDVADQGDGENAEQGNRRTEGHEITDNGGGDSLLLPVIVWIHGGSYSIGSGSHQSYKGTLLAAMEDVVVVTVNYRLGPFGYLVTGPKGSGGANGLLDQILALEWIQRRIPFFGGDPKRVTLVGGSAGGYSVCALAVSERAKGLFQRAIIQSGQCLSEGFMDPEEGKEATEELLNAPIFKKAEVYTLDDLREIPWQGLTSAQKEIPTLITPTIDHTSKVLPVHPGGVYADPKKTINPTDMIVGANAFDDGTMEFGFYTTPEEYIKQASQFDVWLQSHFGQEEAAEVLKVYSPERYNDSYVSAYSQFRGDLMYLCFGRELAALAASKVEGNVYSYTYAHLSSHDWAFVDRLLEKAEIYDPDWASHWAEIPFVFGNILGRNKFGRPHRPTEEEWALSLAMMGRWANFARSGVPDPMVAYPDTPPFVNWDPIPKDEVVDIDAITRGQGEATDMPYLLLAETDGYMVQSDAAKTDQCNTVLWVAPTFDGAMFLVEEEEDVGSPSSWRKSGRVPSLIWAMASSFLIWLAVLF